MAPCGMRAFSCAGKRDGQNRVRSGAGVSPLLVSTSSLPCWMVEEFVVAEECTPCSNFQAVSICFLPLFSHISSVPTSFFFFFILTNTKVHLTKVQYENVQDLIFIL